MSFVFNDLTVNDTISGSGVTVHASVRIATTAPGTLAGNFSNGDSVDGVTLNTGDRILIKDQASGVENGVYDVTAGVPVRAIDYQANMNVASTIVFVQEGATNQETSWICMNNSGSDVVGTNALVFQSFGVSDHGQLTGLTDDDHPQYLPGTRTGVAQTASNAGTSNEFVADGAFDVQIQGRLIAATGAGNTATGTASTVLGGRDNTASGDYSTVAGGGGANAANDGNFATATGSTVGGGRQNNNDGTGTAQTVGTHSTISGGDTNNAAGNYSAIGGGINNNAPGLSSMVGGGNSNNAPGESSTVGGGSQNTASDIYSTASGGSFNTASGANSTVAGGFGGTAFGANSTVGGGRSNTASGVNSTVGGGQGNGATGMDSTIAGGGGTAFIDRNFASALGSTIGGGSGNNNDGTGNALTVGTHSTIGGGILNNASALAATVSGGAQCAAMGAYATVGGGFGNIATGNNTTIGGGGGLSVTDRNTAVEAYSTVAGGRRNNATTLYSTIGGGFTNTAGAGSYATISGGSTNTVSGIYSTLSGGFLNGVNTTDYGTVSGGTNNGIISSDYGTISGGNQNKIDTHTAGNGSIAGGIGCIINSTFPIGAHVCGRYNTTSGNFGVGLGRMFTVGGGSAPGSRSNLMSVLENGQVRTFGPLFQNLGAATDFAEMFEADDAHASAKIPVGTTITFTGIDRKIRPTTNGEEPYGVISDTAGIVLGVAGDEWKNKWQLVEKTEDVEVPVLEDYQVTTLDPDGNEITVTKQRQKMEDVVQEDESVLSVPVTETVSRTYVERVCSNEFDPELTYIPREERPEWNIVGLTGQCKVLPGQPVAPGWVKIAEETHDTILYYIYLVK